MNGRRFNRWTLLAATLLAGCAHYELGTDAKLPFTTLYVEPVASRVLLPQAREPVTIQIRDALEKDGRVTLVDSPSEADATLSVTLTQYRRDVAAVREQDTGLAGKFTLTLGATCTLRDNRSGKAFFENRAVSVHRGAFTDSGQPGSSLVGDQLQSEYNTLPLLAEAMASEVAHTVLDVW